MIKKVFYNHTSKNPLVKSGYETPATIAVSLSDDGKTINYGVSICNECDNFQKARGRNIAEIRLNHNFGSIKVPSHMLALPEKQKCLSFLYNISQGLVIRQRKWRDRVSSFNVANYEAKQEIERIFQK